LPTNGAAKLSKAPARKPDEVKNGQEATYRAAKLPRNAISTEVDVTKNLRVPFGTMDKKGKQ
jgi:hypothetical protein